MNISINRKIIAFIETSPKIRMMMDHWGEDYPAAKLLTLMIELEGLEDYIYRYSYPMKMILESFVKRRGSLMVHGFSKFTGPFFIGFVNSLLEGKIRSSADGYTYAAKFEETRDTYCVPFFVIFKPGIAWNRSRIKGNIDFNNILYWVCPDQLKALFLDTLNEAVHRGLMVNGRPFTRTDFMERFPKLIGYSEFGKS